MWGQFSATIIVPKGLWLQLVDKFRCLGFGEVIRIDALVSLLCQGLEV
jgi:hypothetical protein